MQEVSGRLYICLILMLSYFTFHSCKAKPESEHFKHLRNCKILIRFKLLISTRGQGAELQIAGVGKTPLDFTILQRRRTKC